MNTALALEIYRGLWVVESSRIDALKNVLRDARLNPVYDSTKKLNTFAYFNTATGTIVPLDSGNSDTKEANKISITNINGVITKSGGMSSYGMEEISADMIAADNDPEVIGHFILVDSPGGSAVGMKYMQVTMRGLTKPKVTMVTRQGMAASGGWGILSEGDYVMAESGDAEIGCHGVMWHVSGVPNGQKDANGEVNFIVVSSTSPNKNEAPLKAINNNDTSLMQAEVDKLHLEFRASSKASRPNILDEQMTGNMFPASEVVGTMIDAIGSQKDGINKILELSKSKSNFNPIKIKTKAMTAVEYKAQHPDEYAKVFNAGRAEGMTAGAEAEKDRVDTWMVFHDLDPEAVQKGIESGKAVSNKEMAQFNLKATTAGSLKALKKDAAGNLVAPEAEDKEKVLTADEKEFATLYPKAKAFPNTNAINAN